MICKMKDDEIIQKHEIRKYQYGNTKVQIVVPELTVAQKRKALKKLYDTINEIARHCEERGIDTSDWFYTKEQIEKMKKDPNYIFI